MGDRENLIQALKYEETILRYYQNYARQTKSRDLRKMFQAFAEEQRQHLIRIRSLLNEGCRP
ncbi:MAG: hypothetical protein H5U02_13995 [Clostridia bacterium]|nr:hypothetical protein [Clostridia bacterium]